MEFTWLHLRPVTDLKEFNRTLPLVEGAGQASKATTCRVAMDTVDERRAWHDGPRSEETDPGPSRGIYHHDTCHLFHDFSLPIKTVKIIMGHRIVKALLFHLGHEPDNLSLGFFRPDEEVGDLLQ